MVEQSSFPCLINNLFSSRFVRVSLCPDPERSADEWRTKDSQLLFPLVEGCSCKRTQQKKKLFTQSWNTLRGEVRNRAKVYPFSVALGAPLMTYDEWHMTCMHEKETPFFLLLPRRRKKVSQETLSTSPGCFPLPLQHSLPCDIMRELWKIFSLTVLLFLHFFLAIFDMGGK